jgi:uncharacterized membrane protein YdfJ with MMPL/SSD domain
MKTATETDSLLKTALHRYMKAASKKMLQNEKNLQEATDALESVLKKAEEEVSDDDKENIPPVN